MMFVIEVNMIFNVMKLNLVMFYYVFVCVFVWMLLGLIVGLFYVLVSLF